MSSSNVYDDRERAQAYATLGFPGTYHLAYRDLPALIAEHVSGRRALDFGCGAGRSTRFLGRLGFEAVGVDISRSMIEMATRLDPEGTYRLVADGDLGAFEPAGFDLVFSAFAFDNIPGVEKRRALLRELRRLLSPRGRIILLCSTSDIYLHEWASFSTRDFPENRHAKSGDRVRIVMKDVEDRRPVEDFVWFHRDYLDQFAAAELELLAEHRPLGREDEPYEWLSETSIAPWVIYVLGSTRPSDPAGVLGNPSVEIDSPPPSSGAARRPPRGSRPGMARPLSRWPARERGRDGWYSLSWRARRSLGPFFWVRRGVASPGARYATLPRWGRVVNPSGSPPFRARPRRRRDPIYRPASARPERR